MDRDGLRAGHLIALCGAALLVVALWLPWFQIHIGPLERSQITGMAQQVGGAPVASFADGLLSRLDGHRVSAWTAFGGEDVALAIGGVLVALAILAAGGAAGSGIRVDRQAAARLALLGGLVLGGIVLVRAVDRPGPSGLLAIAPGLWLGLAGCGLMALGGVLAGGPSRSVSSSPPPWPTSAPWSPPGATSTPAPASRSVAGSVPPP